MIFKKSPNNNNRVYYKPMDDITTYELSLCTPLISWCYGHLISSDAIKYSLRMYNELPKEAKRHFYISNAI